MAAVGNWKAKMWISDVDAYGTMTSGYRDPGEVYPFKVSFPEELTPIIGQMADTEGKIIGSFPKSGTPSGSMTFYDMTAENVAAALGATFSVESRTLVTLTAEEFTASAKFGEWTEIGHEQIARNAVIKNEDGTVTYKSWDDDPVDADYRIDLTAGLLMPLAGGQITEGQTLTITGSVPALTQTVVDMKRGSNPLRRIKATVTNRATEETGLLVLYCVKIVPASEVQFSSESTDSPEKNDFNLLPMLPRGGNSYGTWKGLPLSQGFALV